MKSFCGKLAFSFLAAVTLLAAPVSGPGRPQEDLRYSINWPSGLSLGEAHLSASSTEASPEAAARMHFEFDLEASIPGFAASDRYSSEAADGFCSSDFKKAASHGRKRVNEETTFDPASGTATRQTAGGGGKTEMKASSCGRDALTFLYYLRQELGQGRLPPPQTVFFGAPYEVKLNFDGTERIRVADKPVEADHVTAAVKGPASSFSFEVFFLKDAARTPVLVRVPLELGTFSMELVR